MDVQVATQIAYALGIGVLVGLQRSFGTLVERGEVGVATTGGGDDDGNAPLITPQSKRFG